MSSEFEPGAGIVAARHENLEDALNAAMAGESYLVAVWRVENGVVHLYRESQSFPQDDFQTAQALLRRDLAGAAGSQS